MPEVNSRVSKHPPRDILTIKALGSRSLAGM